MNEADTRARPDLDEEALGKLWAKTLPPGAELSTLSSDVTYRPAADPHAATVAGGLEPGQAGDLADGAIPGDAAASASQASSFEVVSELGRGGMGVVFRALQGSLGREVAIKQTLPQHANPASRARFATEARVTGRLEHPNIVPVHELGQAPGGELFLAMKLVGGTSWKDKLELDLLDGPRSGGYDLTRHLAILQSVGNAVAFAHSRGVIHCDLKPDNVMVGEFGEVLVMDWGLATRFTDEERDNTGVPHRSQITAPCGTPCYMPPELAEGNGAAIGPWTDVYLLGAILHELITGAPPRGGTELLKILLEASQSPPPTFEPWVPRELQEICRRALARLPEDRYDSVGGFQKAITDFLQHRESILIASRAEEKLARCERAASAAAAPEKEAMAGDGHAQRDRLYGDFASAIAGFEQALELWPQNPEASAGRDRARIAFAQAALERGDLGLANAQASDLGHVTPERAALLDRIRERQAERAQAQRAARRLRRALLGAVAVIVIGLLTGFVLVNRARRAENEQRRIATQRLSSVLRLSDIKRLEELEGAMESLWPATQGMVEPITAWLVRARDLHDRLDLHRESLAALRTRALEGPDERGRFGFADTETEWEHDTLAALITRLERLGDPDPADGDIASMDARRARASTLWARSLGDHADAWRAAVASIADPAQCPAYAGLQLPPQEGLVPLGRDPDSGLWEFWHLPTGERPGRRDGRPVSEEGAGLVLVLIPGGSFHMGARRAAPDAAAPGTLETALEEDEHDSRGQTVAISLDPFFLSKFEVTQDQWTRFTGSNPSRRAPGESTGGREHTLLQPVEQVSWVQCDRFTRRLGLTIPTEAQWEYATRAGTRTAWWTGPTEDTLQGATNVADAYARDHEGPVTWKYTAALRDGFTGPAPVGSFRANPFGLHDVHGNVWEWCRDWYGSYDLAPRPGDGLRLVPEADQKHRVERGGSWNFPARLTRSAERHPFTPEFRDDALGLRPARAIER